MESAHRLTGARYGIVTALDEAGTQCEPVYSGFTDEQRREMADWPGKMPVFEHLCSQPGPLRVADLAGYVRSLGLEPGPDFSCSFQYAPMRHRDTHTGQFFLAKESGGEAFTDEDEEVLALFALQAAAAVANARARRPVGPARRVGEAGCGGQNSAPTRSRRPGLDIPAPRRARSAGRKYSVLVSGLLLAPAAANALVPVDSAAGLTGVARLLLAGAPPAAT